MLVAVGFAGAANAAYYSITGGGGQAQIGDGLPLPIQVNKTGGGGPIGTGTMFPPLLIPVNSDPAKALIKQTGASAPLPMKVPPGAFKRVPSGALAIGVANNNPKVFQVKTNISFSGPAAIKGSMTFKKNGWRTVPVETFTGTPPEAKAFYTNTGNRFGGASQTRVAALSAIGVWANLAVPTLPCAAPAFGGTGANAAKCWAAKLPAYPMTLAAAGGGMATGGGKITDGVIVTTPGTPAAVPGSVNISATMNGLVLQSAPRGSAFMLNNMAVSEGFPWTTGNITLSAMSALGKGEKFVIKGADGRDAMGEGTISLVAGALSNRNVSGPNANKSWARYTLPEPGATLGAVAALAALAICHGLVRRRR
jgi:hypothetical protein